MLVSVALLLHLVIIIYMNKPIRTALVFLLSFLTADVAYSQYNETIRSGRPGQSIGPFTVGTGIFQIQSGIDINGFKAESTGVKGNGFIFDNVFRYGIAERWEVSALVDYAHETITMNGSETSLNGLAAFDLGGRYHLYTGKGLVPSLGLQARFRIPVLSDDYKISNAVPRFLIVTSQRLSDTFTLVTNWGGRWNGNDTPGTAFYTINVSFPIAGPLSGFIENYGNLTDGDFDTRFDGGFAYLCNNDLQLDVLGGAGNNDDVSDYFVSVGVSWRTKRR